MSSWNNKSPCVPSNHFKRKSRVLHTRNSLSSCLFLWVGGGKRAQSANSCSLLMFELLVAEQTVALLKDCLDCKAIPPLQKKKAELPGERDYLIKKLRLLILLVHTVLLCFHSIHPFILLPFASTWVNFSYFLRINIEILKWMTIDSTYVVFQCVVFDGVDSGRWAALVGWGVDG